LPSAAVKGDGFISANAVLGENIGLLGTHAAHQSILAIKRSHFLHAGLELRTVVVLD